MVARSTSRFHSGIFMFLRITDIAFVRMIILFVLFIAAGCSDELIYRGEPLETIFQVEMRDNGRIAIFTLPSEYWPEKNVDEEALLFYRSDRPLINGLDSLSIDKFKLIKNRKFALLTNATGVDSELNRGIDLMRQDGIWPSLVFEPEHGMFGFEDYGGKEGVRTDPVTGFRVLSLYSSIKKPRPEDLYGIDLIVVDLQNLPVRCYTYVTTLTDLMEAAEENNIELMVLDRPDPYGFWEPAGAMLDMDYISYVGKAPVPFLYSMTPGEYGLYMAHARFHRLNYSVVRVANYYKEQHDAFNRTAWVNPSPNIPTYESALVYAGLVFFEGTNVSLGRGTTRPFVYSGAPFVRPEPVIAALRRLNLPGVQFTPVTFQPTASLHRGSVVHGIQIIPYSTKFDPIRTGYEYMRILHQLYPDEFQIVGHKGSYFMDRLWGSNGYRRAIESDLSYDEFRKTWIRDVEDFERLTSPFHLYVE